MNTTLAADRPLVKTALPGPKSRALGERLRRTECPAFEARREAREASSHAEQSPIVYSRASGINVFDADDNRFVDFISGFGAEVFGHAPAFLTEARMRALGELPLALGDVFGSEPKVLLLEKLAQIFGAPSRVMLGLSGADAVTAALKTAALAVGPRVLAFSGGYHGLSHGPLAACGLSQRFREPFRGQLGDHVTFAEYPTDDTSLERTMRSVDAFFAAESNGQGPGAILVEPILGRGGCVVPPESFLPRLAEKTRAIGARLIVDEVWTGMGRSGRLVHAIANGVTPDLVALGKGLGGGAPISACIGSEVAMAAWGSHGGTTLHTGTHFGNPDGCVAALAVLEHIDDALLSDVRRKGEAWRNELKKILQAASSADAPSSNAVRGEGLMIGLELADAALALRVSRKLLETGYLVLTGGASWNVLTLTPPLTVAEETLGDFNRALASALELAQ